MPAQPPRPHPCLVRRPPPGGQCRAAPSGHPRPSPGPAGTRRPSPRPGRRAGAGHGGQDTDASRFRAGWRRCIDDADALRAGGTALLARSRRHRPWAPGCPRPISAGSCWHRLPSAGLAPDHRPNHLRADWPRKGHATTAIPASEIRLHRCRANTARGAAHFRLGRVDGAGRQLASRGIRLLQAGRALLHHHPPAQKPAEPDRGHTRGGLDAHPILDGRRRRCGRDHLPPFQSLVRRVGVPPSARPSSPPTAIGFITAGTGKP